MMKKPIRKKSPESVGEYFERLGFKKGGRSSTKAAFVQHLIKEAYGVEVTPPEIYQETAPTPSVQLSFFDKKEIA